MQMNSVVKPESREKEEFISKQVAQLVVREFDFNLLVESVFLGDSFLD